MSKAKESPKMETPQGFTPKEAAFQLGITGKALRRAIRKGKLEAQKVSGRWYISPENLSTYKATREAKQEEAKSAE